jgi:O-antigen ligase
MKAIRWSVCALIAFEVLDFGGVEPSGAAILEIGASVLLLCWAILLFGSGDIELHGNWLYIPMAGFIGLSLVQKLYGFTAYPYATKMDLLQWIAILVLCIIAAEIFRTEGQRNQFSWFLILFGFAVALFGVVQHLAFNGKLYWAVVLPQGAEPFGPFVNRDHFAGFVELTAPMGLALAYGGACKKNKAALLSLLTILPIAALLVSGSRGGIVGFAFGCVILLAMLGSSRIERKQILATLAAFAVAVGLAIWLGAGSSMRRFSFSSSDELTRSDRMAMARDTWRIFLDHRWIGTGLGSFATVYPHYRSAPGRLAVTHAHNDYLELLSEMGLLGGVCGLAFLGLLFWRGVANARAAPSRASRAIYAGALAACSGLLVHSLVDFNIHVPSNALLFTLLATLACAPPTNSKRHCGTLLN